MNYCFLKTIDKNNYTSPVMIMSGFDCMCSLMTKIEMMGKNLVDGKYIISSFDEETQEVELEFIIIVEDGEFEIIDTKDCFD